MAHQSRGHLTNQKTLYLYFRKVYGPQILPVGDLRFDDLTHKVTWDFDIVVTWQIKNVTSPLSQGLCILNLASSWLKTRESPPTKSRDTSITRLGDKSKMFYLHIHKAHGPQNLVECWLRMRGDHLKSHVVSPIVWSNGKSKTSYFLNHRRDVKRKLVIAKNKHRNAN